MYSNDQYSNQRDWDEEPLTRDSYESSGSESGAAGKDGSIWPLFCCCLYCCCIFCILPMIMGIVAAVNSRGFTSCPAYSLANATEIPNFHSILTPEYYFWKSWWNQESDVFDLKVSNTSRIGAWRTTKTWYLRDQWAYVTEGGTTPDIIAWTPFSAWQRTFYVKHCGLGAEYQVQQNRYGPWRWGADIVQWQIYSGVQSVATATHVKEHNGWAWSVPNGWQTTVTSNQFGGAVVADMLQTYDSYWTKNSVWLVKDYRPEIIGAWVISFLAVAEEEKESHNNNGRYRRLGAGKDGESEDVEGREQGEAEEEIV